MQNSDAELEEFLKALLDLDCPIPLYSLDNLQQNTYSNDPGNFIGYDLLNSSNYSLSPVFSPSTNEPEIIASVSIHSRTNGRRQFNNEISNVTFAARSRKCRIGVGKTRQVIIQNYFNSNYPITEAWIGTENNSRPSFRLSSSSSRIETDNNRNGCFIRNDNVDSPTFVLYLHPLINPENKQANNSLYFRFLDEMNQNVITVSVCNIYWAGHKHESECKKARLFYENQENQCLNITRMGNTFTYFTAMYRH